MPFIDHKISVPVSEEKRIAIKSRMGEAITTLGKGESFLMIGFEDNYELFFGGEKVEKGAYVAVSIFGKSTPEAYDAMSGQICKILTDELSIPGDRIYITYREVDNWGWNGKNF